MKKAEQVPPSSCPEVELLGEKLARPDGGTAFPFWCHSPAEPTALLVLEQQTLL